MSPFKDGINYHFCPASQSMFIELTKVIKLLGLETHQSVSSLIVLGTNDLPLACCSAIVLHNVRSLQTLGLLELGR